MFQKTYTFNEFSTLMMKRDISTIDKVIGHIKKNKELYLQIIIVLAVIGLSLDISFADGAEVAVGKMDRAGNRFLVLARRVGYWIILIKGLQKVIQSGMAGDTQAVGEIILKYVIIYATLFFFPMALRMVEEVF